MNKVFVRMCTAALLTGISWGQTSVPAQASASDSLSSSTSANSSGAQTQSGAAAGAAAQGGLSSPTSNHSAAAAGSSQLAAGSAIHATLQKPVDARRAKPGDEVIAKTTENVKSDGQVVLPRGTKIVGHVTEAKAYSQGKSESAVGIAFDHAMLKDGREVPLAASIQALANVQSSGVADPADDSAMAAGSAGARASGGNAAGGVLGRAGRAVGTTGGTLVNTSNVAGGVAGGTLQGASSASGALSSNSHGVTGLKGVSLDSAASSSTRGSLITCPSHNVHLDSGTQMILQVSQK